MKRLGNKRKPNAQYQRANIERRKNMFQFHIILIFCQQGCSALPKYSWFNARNLIIGLCFLKLLLFPPFLSPLGCLPLYLWRLAERPIIRLDCENESINQTLKTGDGGTDGLGLYPQASAM